MSKNRWVLLCLGTGALALLSGCLQAPLPPEDASLSITFRLQKKDNFEGIEVILPGTSYRGYTDKQGRVTFDHLPPREYEILAKTNGYRDYRESNIVLAPGDHIYLGEILLEAVPIHGHIRGKVALEDDGNPEGSEAYLLGAGRRVVSATDGSFEFQDVPEGSYELRFYHPGYIADSAVDVTVEAGVTRAIPAVLLRQVGTAIDDQGSVKGKVVLEGSTTMDGAYVFLPGTPVYSETALDGTYWLDDIPSGAHTVVVEKEGYETVRSSTFEVRSSTLNQGPTIHLKRIQPRPSRAALQIVQGQGAEEADPNAPGIVSGHAYYPDRIDHAGILVRLLDPPNQTLTSSDGAFLLQDAPPGLRTVRAEAEGYQAVEFRNVEIRPGDVTRLPQMELEYPTLSLFGPQIARVYGQVILEDRGPQPGVSISLEGTSIVSVSARDGGFLMNDVPFGEYSLIATLEGYEPATARILVESASDVPVPVLTLMPIEEFLEVVETVPSNGARKVEVSDHVRVQIRFSERLLPRTVKPNIGIQPDAAHEVFLPEADLIVIDLMRARSPQVQFESDYTIRVGMGVQSVIGHRLEAPFDLRFRTGGPRVLGSIPESGAEDVILAPNEMIVLEFNAPVNFRDLSKIAVTPDTGEVPRFMVQRLPFGQRVEMQIGLQPSRNYKITIPRTIRTVDRKRFENTPYTIRFRTGSYDELPDVTDIYFQEFNDTF